MRQQIHKYKNLLNKELRADKLNSKWANDVSYIHTEQSVLYLFIIWDLYGSSILAYKIGIRQTVNLVLGPCDRKKEGRGGTLPSQ